MLKDSVEDPTDSKIFPAHFWGNGNFNGLADELAKQKVNHFDNAVILKNEEIGSNFSHELSKDSETWPQQNIEEDRTAVERDNDTRKESHQCKDDSKTLRNIVNTCRTKATKESLEKSLTTVHRLLITPQQLSIHSFYYLAEGCSMKEMAHGYYLGHATVYVIIRETTKVLWEVLAPKELKVPSVEEWEAISKGFFEKWNLPNCLGSVDGEHVNIQAPKHSGFTLVDIGAAGGHHDFAVFSSSGFGNAILSKKLPIPAPKNLPNTNIKFPHFFNGDSAFPLGENIYRRKFGWRILRKPLLCELETCESIVQATVVLHNFVQMKELEIPEEERRYCPTGYADPSQKGSRRRNNLRSVGRVGSNNSKRKNRELRDTLCQ
ncbi:hypothetical protein JTB14_010809 [Gonioctena quinquepunctata]|nr:hypothetical protein JTB14_010809 [Gonioctena quinquepunctata]